MKKILILGVNSFSGSSFAKYIQSKKFKLYGFYHKEKNKMNEADGEKKFYQRRIHSAKMK